MPIDIQGWIEYSPYSDSKEREAEHSWIPWMSIEAIIQHNDEVNWIILGNPRDFQNNQTEYQPIAKNRGFPKNPGRYLAEEIASAKEFTTKHNQEELFGFSHFYFSEIEMIDWS